MKVLTLIQLTQLDAKGGREDLKSDFENLVDAIYALLPKTTPYNMSVSMQPIAFFFLDMLETLYQIDVASPDFAERCREHFAEEVAEDIGEVVYLMGELQKKRRKAKRINAQIEAIAGETIIAYLLSVMSAHIFEKEERA